MTTVAERPASGTAAALVRSALAVLLPGLLLAATVGLVFSRLRQPSAVLPLWRPWAEVGALACGMTAVILTGGIDLSVGSLVGLCGMVLGVLWKRAAWPVELACAGAVATGLAGGAVNATLVVLGIPPLVVTLATMACYSGLALALSGGERVTGFPARFTGLGQGTLGGLPGQLWLLVGVAVTGWVLVHRTRFGRWLYAVGDNRVRPSSRRCRSSASSGRCTRSTGCWRAWSRCRILPEGGRLSPTQARDSSCR
jgi:rhamnose transport system permease protein